MTGPRLTVAAVVEHLGAQLDQKIADELQRLETRIRQEMIETGPEDEAALDVPPDPEAPWRRMTIEEVIEAQRERWRIWRVEAMVKVEAWVRDVAPTLADDDQSEHDADAVH